MAGGGALAPSLAPDLADATGRAVHPPDPSLTDSSAIGAAVVAAAGATGQVIAVRRDGNGPGSPPTAAVLPGGRRRRSGTSLLWRARSAAGEARDGGMKIINTSAVIMNADHEFRPAGKAAAGRR